MKRRNSGLQVRLAGALVLPCCRTLVVTAALAVTSALFALSPVRRPVLPPVEHLDTETVTNVPFTAWQQHLRHFTFKLSFNATTSNNMEMAFGTDRNTGTGVPPVGGSGVSPLQSGGTGTTGVSPVGGSGVSPLQSGGTGTTGVSPVEDDELSPDERDLVVGWDCGAWFVENGATGERVTAAPAGGCGAHELTVRMRIDHHGTIDNVLILDNGVEVFAEFAATKPQWLHSPAWNRLRLVGRGENVRAGERFFAQITPQGTSVRLR